LNRKCKDDLGATRGQGSNPHACLEVGSVLAFAAGQRSAAGQPEDIGHPAMTGGGHARDQHNHALLRRWQAGFQCMKTTVKV
jgi:hypothetical protein